MNPQAISIEFDDFQAPVSVQDLVLDEKTALALYLHFEKRVRLPEDLGPQLFQFADYQPPAVVPNNEIDRLRDSLVSTVQEVNRAKQQLVDKLTAVSKVQHLAGLYQRQCQSINQRISTNIISGKYQYDCLLEKVKAASERTTQYPTITVSGEQAANLKYRLEGLKANLDNYASSIRQLSEGIKELEKRKAMLEKEQRLQQRLIQHQAQLQRIKKSAAPSKPQSKQISAKKIVRQKVVVKKARTKLVVKKWEPWQLLVCLLAGVLLPMLLTLLL